jgi:ribosomal subunit interface protein
MDLEIQAKHTELDPQWRELIERRIAKLQGQGTRFIRIHVTLEHNTHHAHGFEEVRILASVAHHTLRVQKTKPDMAEAIQAAFAALERELEPYQSH